MNKSRVEDHNNNNKKSSKENAQENHLETLKGENKRIKKKLIQVKELL